jgi:hypothetical protein
MRINKKVLALFLAGTLVIAAGLSSALTFARNEDEEKTKNIAVVFVLDTSGSMEAAPLKEMKSATIQFCEELLGLSTEHKVAIVSFASDYKVLEFTSNIEDLKNHINGLTASGTTYMTPALTEAGNLLNELDGNVYSKNIFVLADGVTTNQDKAEKIADDCKKLFDIYSVGYFHNLDYTELDKARDFMKKIQNCGYFETTYFNGLLAQYLSILYKILYPLEIKLTHEYVGTSAPATYKHLASDGNTYDYIREYYRITAKITNSNPKGVLKKIKLTLLIGFNGYFLVDNYGNDVKNEIEFLQLNPESTGIGSWNVTLLVPPGAFDQNIEYEVIVESEGVEKVTNYGSMFLNGNGKSTLEENEIFNIFDISRDSWNFNNWISTPLPINVDDIRRLKYGMPDNTKKIFDYSIEKGGALCYGMAVTSILAKYNRINLNDLQPGASFLHEVNYNNKVGSLISYYYLTQCIGEIYIKIKDLKMDQKTKIEKIKDMAELSMSNKNPFVILVQVNYQADDGSGKKWIGHALTAYGLETKSAAYSPHDDDENNDNRKLYDSKIHIYDNNFPDRISYLYFNSDTDEWTIEPYFKVLNIDEAKIITSISDINLLDIQNISENAKNIQQVIYAHLYTDFRIRTRYDELRINGMYANGADNVSILPVYGSSDIRIYLDDPEQPFSIEPQVAGEPLDISVLYKSVYASVEAIAQSADYSPDGKVGITGNNGSYRMVLTCNDTPIKWSGFEITGTNADVSFEVSDNGYILRGDDLSDIKVTGDKDDEFKDLSFSTTRSSVLIGQQGDELVALIDDDNNGTYETLLDSSGDVTDISGSPTPSPMRSPSQSPSPSPMQSPSKSATQSPSPSPMQSPSKSATQSPTQSPTKTPTPASTSKQSPTSTPTPASSSSSPSSNTGGNSAPATATPAPAIVVKAERDGVTETVAVIPKVLGSEFKLTPPKPLGKYQSPTKIEVDVSSLTTAEKAELTGVIYNGSGAVSKRLGGETSADAKTFAFYTYEEGTADYGVIRAADLTQITLRIGANTYDQKNAAKTTGDLDVSPYIDKDTERTMVPLRFIAESLGAVVNWEPYDVKQIKVSIVADGKTLAIVTGQDVGNGLGSAFLDGESNRTFVPLRYILEQFGANVVWFGDTQEIRIYR